MAENNSRSARSRAMLLLGVVFFIGLISGAALFYLGQRSVMPGPPPPGERSHPMERLNRELQLDEEQQKAVREVLERQRVALDGVLEDSRLEISEVLTPEQRQRLDEMRPQRLGDHPPGHRPPNHPPAGRPPRPPRRGAGDRRPPG